MMAAAEARAAWQRTANRCFVQEDAKRAPKLACCPSSSSSSKPQVDAGSGDAAQPTEQPIAGFVPLNWNSSNSNLPPDTRWWLQLQPNYVHHQDFTREQLNVLDIELEALRAQEVCKTSKVCEETQTTKEENSHVGSTKDCDSSLDPRSGVFAACMKHEFDYAKQELKAVNTHSTHQPLKQKDLGEYWCRDKDLDFDPLNRFLSKEPHKLFDWESPWNGSEKTEPWWRAVDKDDLAYLVAQKSLDHIENCDLPPPQNMNVIRSPFSCLECFEKDKNFLPSSLDREVSTCCYSRSCLTCSKENGKRWSHSEQRSFPYGTEKPFSLKPIRSASSTDSHSSTNNDLPETVHTSGSEPSKAELLEALRHSQTRAREAEKAAQQAYNEKEHIIKLFFRQASHLFAYKQWLQILQLETLCLQLKNKDQPISSLFPVLLPWMPYKAGQWKKSKHKPKKDKRGGRSRYDISKYAVIFAVGLGLAGAGLLLGWTMGWLLPIESVADLHRIGSSTVCTERMDAVDVPSQWEFSCNLEVDYGSAENASIVYAALAVDKELQPDKVKRQMSLSEGKLLVHFEAVEARFLRASFSAFVDILTLATKTIEEFGSDMKL
ncbi:hypothetical protein Sjap_005547 [Stephania japonica]|uniref:Uncharacterized protein n=1 Tax=Stephania japonica TaxID=461633 RepID=A0AAP0PK70_9MAGN